MTTTKILLENEIKMDNYYIADYKLVIIDEYDQESEFELENFNDWLLANKDLSHYQFTEVDEDGFLFRAVYWNDVYTDWLQKSDVLEYLQSLTK